MGTIIEKDKNITLKCNHCNTDILYHINEVKTKKYIKNEAALCSLTQGLYKRHQKEIVEKFQFYKNLGYKGKQNISDTGLSIDEHRMIYEAVCPKCGKTIKKIEVIDKDYYIKIYPPKSEEFSNSEILWIPLNKEEVDKYF